MQKQKKWVRGRQYIKPDNGRSGHVFHYLCRELMFLSKPLRFLKGNLCQTFTFTGTPTESCVKSVNKKANVVIRSYVEYNAIELGMKVFPSGSGTNTVGPKGSLAVNVKSSVVSLILAVTSAVLFYNIES